jgi:hypothetical protein
MAKAGCDAQALVQTLRDCEDIETALKAYNAERQPLDPSRHAYKLATQLGVGLKRKTTAAYMSCCKASVGPRMTLRMHRLPGDVGRDSTEIGRNHANCDPCHNRNA